MCTVILASPTATATAFMSIPVINAKCEGLSNPSTPKVSCQRKSDGPATKETADPIMSSLNAVTKDFFLSSLFLNNKTPLNPAVLLAIQHPCKVPYGRV